MDATIAARRLSNQHVAQAAQRAPADVVGWLGAMQAQEYEVAKWAIGLRLRNGGVDAAIERAFDQGRILRTHVMRPTWHFVTPADIRWLLDLTAPRVQRIMASYNRRLELDPRTLARGLGVIARGLRDRQYRTRAELAERLQRAGLPMKGQRLAHLVMHGELEGVICSGPRRGRQFTYGLIAERAPGALRVSRDEALARLVRRYFQSHGPATARDFAWWSGLTAADARRGLEINRARPEQVGSLTYWVIGRERRAPARDDLVHLLPIYDEYLIAYRDRVAVPHGPPAIGSAPRNAVTFQHALVIRGQVAGTWRLAQMREGVRIQVVPLRPLTALEQRALGAAVARYARFLASPVAWSITAS
jgi:hypothetical protein